MARLALVPINPTVGDLAGNAAMVAERAVEAGKAGADIAVFPELAISGYPPRDLLDQEGFCEAARAELLDAAARIARDCPELTVVVGCPWSPGEGDVEGLGGGRRPRNSAVVVRGGEVIDRYDKRLLPNYDIFDEHRYFEPGMGPKVIEVAGLRVGFAICEDLWRAADVPGLMEDGDHYHGGPDPVAELVALGAELIVVPTASPFAVGKRLLQHEVLSAHVRRWGVPIASVNQLGGNDDLVFDGACEAIVPAANGETEVVARQRFSLETVMLGRTRGTRWQSAGASVEAGFEGGSTGDAHRDVFRALVLGVRDYARKTGFERVCLGVSGGIDSALTATIAAAAVGPERVLGCMMPSRYSSEGSVTDAEGLAENLGIGLVSAPIGGPHEALESLLGPVFDELCGAHGVERAPGVTEENLQSRLRGTIMMGLSNKLHALLLTTGNKSELAVGYSTLYGDMNGGLAVLADITKVRVFALSRWINEHYEECGFSCAPIPVETIEKPPSAELREDQKDSDSLPAYEVLDEIVERYVEKRQSPARIVREAGIEPAIVKRVVRMIDVAEYKRKQLAIGLKVTGIAFGRGRRRPIANGYRPERSLEAEESAASA